MCEQVGDVADGLAEKILMWVRRSREGYVVKYVEGKGKSRRFGRLSELLVRHKRMPHTGSYRSIGLGLEIKIKFHGSCQLVISDDDDHLRVEGPQQQSADQSILPAAHRKKDPLDREQSHPFLAVRKVTVDHSLVDLRIRRGQRKGSR